jgi:hypothetical protein
MLVYIITTRVRTNDAGRIRARNGNDLISTQAVGAYSTHARARDVANHLEADRAGCLSRDECCQAVITSHVVDAYAVESYASRAAAR